MTFCLKRLGCFALFIILWSRGQEFATLACSLEEGKGMWVLVTWLTKSLAMKTFQLWGVRYKLWQCIWNGLDKCIYCNRMILSGICDCRICKNLYNDIFSSCHFFKKYLFFGKGLGDWRHYKLDLSWTWFLVE